MVFPKAPKPYNNGNKPNNNENKPNNNGISNLITNISKIPINKTQKKKKNPKTHQNLERNDFYGSFLEVALALRTIASMGLLWHGFHKLFPAMASSKQWGLWASFVGFMAVGFGEEEKMGFVGRRERLYIGNVCRRMVLLNG